MTEREALEQQWFELTRERMPAVAEERGWPVRFDHCFQRILLDAACEAPWREVIDPPAFRNASDRQLRAAIKLGESALAGIADLAALNRQSLAMRGKL